MRFPSFSDWIHGKSLITQMMWDMSIRAAPFMAGYVMLIYYYLSIRPQTVWEMVSGPMFAVPALVMSVGSLLVEQMRRNNMNMATEHLGINMALYWTPQAKYEEVNIIDYINPLKEYAYTPQDIEDMDNMEKQYIYGNLYKHGFRPGRYYYEIGFNRQMPDLHEERWNKGIFLCDFPGEDVFRRIPDQFMMHNGTFFTTAAASVVAYWCTEYSELEEYRVFRVMSSPQHAYIAQVGLGILPVDVDKETIEEAAQLNIKHDAIKWAMKADQASARERTVLDESRDSREVGYGLAGEIISRSQFIREPSRLESLKGRTRTLLIVGAACLLIFLYWYFYAR